MKGGGCRFGEALKLEQGPSHGEKLLIERGGRIPIVGELIACHSTMSSTVRSRYWSGMGGIGVVRQRAVEAVDLLIDPFLLFGLATATQQSVGGLGKKTKNRKHSGVAIAKTSSAGRPIALRIIPSPSMMRHSVWPSATSNLSRYTFATPRFCKTASRAVWR